MMVKRRASPPPVLDVDQDEYLDSLAAELEVNLRDLEGELAVQPDVLQRAGREAERRRVAQEVAQRDHLHARARVDAQLRRVAEERGLSVSETELSLQVTSEATVARTERAVAEARHRARRARVVYRAHQVRAQILMALIRARAQASPTITGS